MTETIYHGNGQVFQNWNSPTSGSTTDADVTLSDKFAITVDQNMTITISNAMGEGQTMRIMFISDGSVRSITWGSGIVANSFTTTIGKNQTFTFTYYLGNWYETERSNAI